MKIIPKWTSTSFFYGRANNAFVRFGWPRKPFYLINATKFNKKMRSKKFNKIIQKLFNFILFYFLNFFYFLIAFQSTQYSQQQHSSSSSLISPQQQLLYQQQQTLLNNRALQFQNQQRPIRPSLFDPILKVKSYIGYVPTSAKSGTFVQIEPSEKSPPLQILVEDKDLQPGTPSAIYQYILSGYGAERFAVDHQGNLYLADATNLKTFETEKNPFILHVIAKKHKFQKKLINKSIYIANVSALAIGERAIAQIKAKDNNNDNNIIYRIIDVSDGAFNSFRYDELSNELRAVGPLLPGHKYKVVIEARDSDGLIGSSTSTNIEKQQLLLPLEQFISVDLSELTPIGTFITSLDGESINNNNPLIEKSQKKNKYFRLIGDGDGGKFILEQQNGILFTGGNLDREKDKIHRLRIETRSKYPFDQLLYITNVKINVIDANDNAPHFVDPQPLILKIKLDELPFSFSQTTNMLLGKINVEDLDEGENGKISLKVLPPLDRLFTVNNEGELRINGPLTSAHLGEHYLTLMAIDNGQQPLESRSVVIVRIDTNKFKKEEEELIITTTTIIPLINKIPKIFNNNQNNKYLSISSSSSSSEGSNSISNSKQIIDTSNDKENNYEKQLFSGLSRVGISKNENKINDLFISTTPLPPFTRVDIPLLSNNLPTAAIGKISLIEPKKQKTRERNLKELNNNNIKIEKTLSNIKLPFIYSTTTTTTTSPFTTYSIINNSNKTININNSLNNSLPLNNNFSPLISITSTDSSIQNNIITRIAPIFTTSYLKIFVEENEEQLELTKLTAYYPDEEPGPITYVLLAGDQSIFSINSSNGIITLLKPLDAESIGGNLPPIYFLKIGTIEGIEQQYFDKENGTKIELINDPNLPHFCEIQINVIDINDWIPNFEQNIYEFTLPSTAESGTIIGQVNAFDQDITSPNNKLFYYIIPKKNNSLINSISAEKLFSLNSQTGELKTNENLSNFSGKILGFGIRVVDGGINGTELNSTAKVFIHLEGIKSNEDKKQLITTTKTTISWKNIESNEEEEEEEEEEENKNKEIKEQLKINNNNNFTTKQLIKNEEFNKINKNNNISLFSKSIVNVKNSSFLPSSINKKTIQFSSHNFNISIMEGTRPPYLIKILPIINKPIDTRFTICAIKDGNLRGAFSVAQNNEGNCELRTQMQLDRETISHYLLNITVENGGQQDWALININVLDLNDNRPKFILNKIEGDKENNEGGVSGGGNLFVVLPIEALANQRFYRIIAEDIDEPGSGNSLISYSIDNSEEGNIFGIDPQSGEIWPKKGADELEQLFKKNFFKIIVIACDNPDEPKLRLCSRISISITLLNNKHRFVIILSGNKEKIKEKEKEIINCLLPFTFPCLNPIIERIEEIEEKEKKYFIKRSKEYLINLILYSINLKERKICLKQEMKKLFLSDTKELIGISMNQLGIEFLDLLIENNNKQLILNNKSRQPIYSAKIYNKEENTDDFSSGVTGLATLLFPIDWSNNNTINVLIGISSIITFIALIGLISLCVFRYRHKQIRRKRAEQIRRRHHQQQQQQAYCIGGIGGFHSTGGGLLAAVNGVKASSNYSTQFDNGEIVLNNNGRLYNTKIGCNGGGNNNNIGHSSCLFGSNNNFYMSSTSSGTPLGGGGGGGHFERGNKLYESQIRELPVCDDENIERKWKNKKHQPNCKLYCQNNNLKLQTSLSPPSSSPLSSNQRLNGGSSLLLLPPPPNPPPKQPTPHGRRLTNSENVTTSSIINSGHHLPRQFLKHYSPPATIGLQRNQEGDFSIDESFYTANGQSRYIY
ncbi:hypothetical protein Mgra_00007519 [Meloidogyne graminicola]|uniref:Cadherin domain-containing protein n=1 Tax=Meloidogyne graminicola TaxID=189291 RepID=A0A8S9ZIJ6_9BILA|nr:hypothetical protein Mgra_00007519 [Meloidogyne graminicola]